jgi:hypothetical protein
MIHAWSDRWQLCISAQKCCILEVKKPSVHYDNVFTYKLGADVLKCTENVSDLGVTVDSHLVFNSHIASIVRKAHQRANLILRCFLSREIKSLVKAYTVYVRPLLEFNSPIWSPRFLQDINCVENVQRRFTKRLPGMQNLSYLARLKKLNLESLEIRRLRADLILMYKILFGLVDVAVDDFFVLNVSRNNRGLRAHCYQVMQPVCISTFRHAFFTNRTIPVWNSLPIATNFTSLACFKKSINSNHLLKYCKANFI